MTRPEARAAALACAIAYTQGTSLALIDIYTLADVFEAYISMGIKDIARRLEVQDRNRLDALGRGLLGPAGRQ